MDRAHQATADGRTPGRGKNLSWPVPQRLPSDRPRRRRACSPRSGHTGHGPALKSNCKVCSDRITRTGSQRGTLPTPASCGGAQSEDESSLDKACDRLVTSLEPVSCNNPYPPFQCGHLILVDRPIDGRFARIRSANARNSPRSRIRPARGVSIRSRSPGPELPLALGRHGSPLSGWRPAGPRPAAVAPPGGVAAALADQGEAHRLQRLELAGDPVAAAGGGPPRRFRAAPRARDPEGELGLERLDRAY